MTDAKPAQLEQLLAETGWVRRLAQRFVSDEHSVDDLVQETHLAALRRRPHGDVRAWLAAVLRKLVSRHRRDAAIRDRHERLAATGEAVEDRGVQRVRLQRALADAILTLEPSHRTAIIERYFDELPYAAIALRHGTTEAAARKRVSRARTELRAALKRRGFDRRLWWCIPLRPRPVGPASVAVGGTIMGWKALSLLAAAALVLAVGMLQWTLSAPLSSDHAEPAAEPGTAALEVHEAPNVNLGEVKRMPAGGAAAPPPVIATSSLPRRELRGSAADSTGQRIAGARVEIRRDPLREYAPPDPDVEAARRRGQTVAETVTDELGEFSVELPIGQPIDVWVDAPGFSTAVVPDRYAGDHVAVGLRRAAAFEGRVYRADDGTPVAGARLSAWRDGASRLSVFAGVTDAAGAFRFDGLEPGAIRVLVIAPTLSPLEDPIALQLVEGETLRHDFRLQPGLTVHGTVVDELTRQPIAGATVGQGWRSMKSTKTNADGRYRLPGFSRDGAEELHVRAPGYGRAIAIVSFSGGNASQVNVALTPGMRAVGRVVDPEGHAIAGAYAAAVARVGEVDATGADWRSTKTRADGSFELDDLRTDAEHTLLVIREGFGPAMIAFPTDQRPTKIELGTIRLSPGGSLSGQIVDQSGNDVGDCRLRLVGTTDNPLVGVVRDERNRWVDDHVYLNQRIGRTDGNGQFHFFDLAPGDYRIEVSPYRSDSLTVAEEFDGAVSRELRVGPAQAVDDVRIVLDVGQLISGRLSSPAGEPVASMLVWLTPIEGDGAREANVVTGADGRFEFRVANGLYQLRAYPTEIGGPSPPFMDIELDSVRSGETGLELVLEPSALTTGRVLNADGSPAIKASVVAFDASGEEVERSFTKNDGRFALNLAPGVRVDLLARPAPGDGPFWNPAFFPPRSAGVEQTRVLSGTTGLTFRLPR